MTFRGLGCLFFAAAFFLSAPPAQAEVEYRAEFFSYEGAINTAASSHTFARFSKVENGRVTEVVDISWMPRPGHFRRRNRMPLLRTVPGRNYTLEQTRVIAGGKPILSHGVYSITPELFEAARRQKAKLESGRYAYKMLDKHPGDRALNCIHAVSGVLGFLKTGLSRGGPATSRVVSYFLRSGQMRPLGRLPARRPASRPPLPARAPHANHGVSEASPAGTRPQAQARYYSTDTSASYVPLSESTVAVDGIPVPSAKDRPVGWRLGAAGEVIWVFRSADSFPK